jgi:hypothetical protein
MHGTGCKVRTCASSAELLTAVLAHGSLHGRFAHPSPTLSPQRAAALRPTVPSRSARRLPLLCRVTRGSPRAS